jgi:hypothetical protein
MLAAETRSQYSRRSSSTNDAVLEVIPDWLTKMPTARPGQKRGVERNFQDLESEVGTMRKGEEKEGSHHELGEW